VHTVVVGAGQAGLAVSRGLAEGGIEHAVLERDRIGASWRGRWDSFCLVTPNWSVALPGAPYDGSDPEGYMPRDEIIRYFDAYAGSFGAPVREGVAVLGLEPRDGGFLLELAEGADALWARHVVVATGAYQRAYRPPGAGSLPTDLERLDVEAYRNPSELPPGAVLIVGSGQTGCQLAEELHAAGREVFLSCGRAPWVPRRVLGRDVFWWAVETGFLRQRLEDLPSPAARLTANLLTTGHDGGHDLHLRTLRALGVTLLGRFLGAEGHRARFADDLAESVAWGDARQQEFMGLVRRTAAELGMPEPDVPEPEPFDPSAPTELDLRGVGVVLFTGGFRPDYSWIRVPGVCDELGFPIQSDGASFVAPGLWFVGVHFLRTRGSSLLFGVGEDATLVAERIAKEA
jgi:putative flavoprotein involved in K+ transport